MRNVMIDLDLTNYREHPTRKGYYVFRFKDHKQGNYFEMLLIEEKLHYEKAITENEERLMLFAIQRRDLKRAERMNYLTSARFRSRFIPQKGLRIFTIGLFFLLILLALIGFLLSD